MILFPNAKINIGLRILRKREDGFHDIESVMFPIPVYDILELLPSDEFVFKQTGLQVDSAPGTNLCEKAFHLMKEKHGIPNVYLHLRKQIPMGAGLGGGSSDAAFVLKGLNDLFELNLETELLESYAAKLGSDCAFFVKNCPQIATGRGEVLTPFNLTLKGKFFVLLNPGIHVGTKEAYSGVVPQLPDNSLEILLNTPIKNWKNTLVNDFETSVFHQFPAIGQLKDKLYQLGADYAAMSGSGSSVFGIFEESVNLPKELEEFSLYCGEL